MSNPNNTKNDLGLTLSIITLRLWLAMRAIVTGIEKFAGTKSSDAAVEIDGAANAYGLTESTSQKVYSLENYSGVPGPLYDKFLNEPLIPEWALKLYDVMLGPALLLFGLTLLIGLATRISLFALGLIYTSLTLGLILIKQDAGVAWLGIHVALVAFALCLAKHNRVAILSKW